MGDSAGTAELRKLLVQFGVHGLRFFDQVVVGKKAFFHQQLDDGMQHKCILVMQLLQIGKLRSQINLPQ